MWESGVPSIRYLIDRCKSKGQVELVCGRRVDAACLCLLMFWCQGQWANKGVSPDMHVKRDKVNASSYKPKEGCDSRNVVRERVG